MRRREFLKGAGAVTVLVAGGGIWRAHDRGVWGVGRGPAYEPWRTWRADASEGPLALVRAGILAANPHNTQPWLFRVTESSVQLLADTRRHLGAFDAYRREMFLGLGCALENMMLAARAIGYAPKLRMSEGSIPPPDDGEPLSVARIDLAPADASPSVLHDAIPRRHTHRGRYDPNRPIPSRLVAALHETDPLEERDVKVLLIADPAERARFGALIVEATETIIADETMVHDSERWYRHHRAEVQRHRDGPTLDATGLPPLRIAVAKMLPRPSAEDNHAYWLANTRDVQVPTATLFGLIAVTDLYDIGQTLRAGRLWQRMHLRATTEGLAMQPLNQPVELVDRERALGRDPAMATSLAAFTGDAAWKPTFAFRAGYPEREVPPSPRRPLEEVLL